MASATPKPQKRLAEFLYEEQEPFLLEVYLSESEYSKRWSLDGDSSNTSEKSTKSGFKKRKKGLLLPFCQVLKAIYNKLGFHNESKNSLTKFHDQRTKHEEGVPEPSQVNDIVQFSSYRFSTMFNSCQDIDEEGISILSHKDQDLFYSHTLCNMGPQRRKRRRLIEGGHELVRKIPVRRAPNVSEEVRRMQQRIRSDGVILPKKIREDSLLSATIWSSLLNQSIKKGNCCTRELGVLLPGTNDVSQILKSKRVLHRIKKMLFDCVKDIAITLPTQDDRKKGNRQFMGPLQIGKVLPQRTKKWGQQAGDGENLTYLLTSDYLNSIMEWRRFEPHVKDISVEITDAILDNIHNEIALEMIGTLTRNR